MNLAFKILCHILIVGGLFSIYSNNATGQTLDYFYDPTFTPENIVGRSGASVNSILIHEDDKYAVAGSFNSSYPLYIDKAVRFLSDGSVDESFDFQSDPMIVGYMQVHNNGYLSNHGGWLYYFNSDGASEPSEVKFLDYCWSPYNPDTWPPPRASHVQIMDDNKIMVAGRFSPDTTDLEDRRHLVRVHPDGSPDPSFVPLKCNVPFNARINNLYPTPDGKWMIAGEFMDIEGFDSPGIARLNEDFSIDTTFHSPFPDYTWSVRVIPGSHPQKLSGAIDEQNRVYVGAIDPDLAFPSPLEGLGHYRLLPDGSIDTTFQLGELKYLDYYGEGNYYPGSIYTMAFEPDGSLIVGGRFRTIEGQSRGNIAKINEDGSLIDGVFHRQGADTANWQNGNNPDIDVPHINRIVRLDNGGLMVGGAFSRYDGHDQWGVVRLLPSPVGIEENYMNTISVACFPNPASDFVRFSVEDPSLPATAEIEIYNTSGKQVRSHSNYLLQQPLNISALGAGIYNVVIRFEEKQVGTARFVKME